MDDRSGFPPSGGDFIRNIVARDRQLGVWGGRLCTRFPPEPNGFLHIGHAKAICLSYALAQENGGSFHLRFDDTNPEKESEEYVEAIKRDVSWLGADWGENLFFASDYFGRLYDLAVELIKRQKAYVDDLSAGDIRRYRGTLTEPGKNSPYRDRTVQENLDLFARMRQGAFNDGEKSLRAKIGMASPNINMRDPVVYRIRHARHHRTGDRWCIYPTYDFTHPLSDSIERITHSLCTLEFEDHRPFYDWICQSLGVHHPRQIEFARLNLDYTVMSKRHLARLVEGGTVAGWDDPRLPSVAGMRRRGYTPESVREFCAKIGVTKKDSSISVATLEACVREQLEPSSRRRFGVLDPLEVKVVNWEGGDRQIEVADHPGNPSMGSRTIGFGKTLYIEREDFAENPEKKYFRLAPGRIVRLKYAYILEYVGHSTDEEGRVTRIECTYVEGSLGGVVPEGIKKPKGIIHWVSAHGCVEAEVRLYDRLLKVAKTEGGDLEDCLNDESLRLVDAKVEASLSDVRPGDTFQFERKGYFCVDEDSRRERIVFNRTVTLKDAWQKVRGQSRE